MATTNTPTRAYELVDDWEFEVNVDGVRGVRVYLETDDGENTIYASFSKVNVPNIGDAWDSDYPFCEARSLKVKYVNDSDLCGRRITVAYNTSAQEEPPQDEDPTSAEDLPKSVDISGEINPWDPIKNNSSSSSVRQVKWGSNNENVNQTIYKHTGLATIRLQRVIKSFDTYMTTAMSLVSKINADEFLGFATERVLFDGLSASQFTNKAGEKRWTVDLSFTVRIVTNGDQSDSVTSLGNDGWNWVINEATGKFDYQYTGDVAEGTAIGALYATTSFDPLFQIDPLGSEENLDPVLSLK